MAARPDPARLSPRARTTPTWRGPEPGTAPGAMANGPQAAVAWMFEDNEKANAGRAGFLARVPLGRLGEPEDLAGPPTSCTPFHFWKATLRSIA